MKIRTEQAPKNMPIVIQPAKNFTTIVKDQLGKTSFQSSPDAVNFASQSYGLTIRVENKCVTGHFRHIKTVNRILKNCVTQN